MWLCCFECLLLKHGRSNDAEILYVSSSYTHATCSKFLAKSIGTPKIANHEL